MRACLIISALLLAGCPDAAGPVTPGSRGAALQGVAEVPHRTSLGLSDARVVVRASWGSAADQVGLRDEASRPGPMDIAVHSDGVIHLLDQVNRRVQRFDAAGALLSPYPLDSDTTEYIALSGGRVWALTYRPRTSGYSVERIGPRGAVRVIDLPAGDDPVTGLFARGDELWLERAHDRVTRILPAGEPATVMGRPHPGAPGHHVTAVKMSHGARLLGVSPGDTTYRLLDIRPPAGFDIHAIEGLASDATGRAYLALLLAPLDAPLDREWHGARRVAVVHRPGASALTVELAMEQTADLNNYLATGPHGGLYQLQTTAQGVTVRRWQIPSVEVRP